MDQIVHRMLRFDRFALDLSKACLQVDGRTIDLRPKTFAVLQQLAESPGRLISKDSFSHAVWRDVAVGDDSLSRCIHELRVALGDDDRRLIKTVPRRGYLLNATPVEVTAMQSEPPLSQKGFVGKIWAAVNGAGAGTGSPRWRIRATVAATLSIAAAASLLLIASHSSVNGRLAEIRQLFAPQAENLMSKEDGKRVAALAAEKELPLPVFHIEPPARDVPDNVRKFLGVWVSDAGWVTSQRQLMMIVTGVQRSGVVSGYFVNGPAKPHSRVPGPAFSGAFAGQINGETLRYDGTYGMHLASLKPDGLVELKLFFQDGTAGFIVLHPVWTLQVDERNAKAF